MEKKLKSGILALGISALFLIAQNAVADDNGGIQSTSTTVNSLPDNHGLVACTAAINHDGTLASNPGQHVDQATTIKLNTGRYQVGFNAPCDDIRATQGFARWVQVDTLQIGTTSGTCVTADRAGVNNAVWIHCKDASGANVDLSFFLYVAR